MRRQRQELVEIRAGYHGLEKLGRQLEFAALKTRRLTFPSAFRAPLGLDHQFPGGKQIQIEDPDGKSNRAGSNQLSDDSVTGLRLETL